MQLELRVTPERSAQPEHCGLEQQVLTDLTVLMVQLVLTDLTVRMVLMVRLVLQVLLVPRV